ncbi:Zn-dependent hydrolase [Aquibacillus albus]|uniref:N-carbamoyl-L-amino-acid hydrolase n=1 Tax=Aquibacillus albus TaxID=1168171 RepID=A0ABS2N5L9_9BACI|nr:Zn-dependent hydrolase [Aquibacillus albus]MBM7573430.1 N-carbamoyl-L-amino-acid hydrolase [Aquibacillus albus]
MDKSTVTVNKQIIEQKLSELGKIGRNANGGMDRTTFTPAEIEARNWLKDELDQLNVDVRVDQAANIWARRQGQVDHLPAIAFGSHIDSVPNGGMYDGALGVILALEVMRVLDEQGIKTKHPLELVSFSAEEPNPFGLSTFGSRAITGKLAYQDIEGVTDPSGKKLTTGIKEAGGDPDDFEGAVRKDEAFSAFLEVHIEQGKRLLNRDIPVGVVTGITGIYREEVTVLGEANHAGTTLMKDRSDAFLAAANMSLELEAILKAYPDEEVVGTIGQVFVKPNATNIVPGEVTFSLEIRGQTNDKIQDVLAQWEAKMETIKKDRLVDVQRKKMLDQQAVPMNRDVIACCEEQSKELGYPSYRLGSMAGHDAAHMASITRSGMLFVPSLDGKSHCPEEESRMEDIEKVANVLLHSILTMDQKEW